MIRRWLARRKMRWAVRWWANLEPGARAALLDSRRRAQELHLMAYHRRDLEFYRHVVESRLRDAPP